MVYRPREYWEQRFASSVDISTVGHLGLGRAYNSWLYRARRRALRRTLRRAGIVPAGQTLLDVGVGSGAYLDFWRRLGVRRIVGADLTATSVKTLKQRFPEHGFLQWDVTHSGLPFRRESFDIVAAFDVLFHVTDDANFRQGVANLASLVKPGGWLLLSDGFGERDGLGGVHERHRTGEAYESILRRAAFGAALYEPIFVTMGPVLNPETASGRRIDRFTRVLLRVVAGLQASRQLSSLNHVVGATLYALDGLLLKMVRRGPSLHVLAAGRLSRSTGE